MKRVLTVIFSLLLIISVFSQTISACGDIEVWGGFGRKDNVYSHAETDQKMIALTFDDGPHPRRTAEILDILAEYGVKATFFVIGKNAEAYPKTLLRVANEGHEIGNHTYSHMTAKGANMSKFKSEIERTDKIIEDIIGVKPTLFRPPTGYCDSMTVQSVTELNHKIVVWTVDTMDWAHNNENNIVKTIRTRVKCGSIILMHDFIAGNSPTPNVLRRIIPELLEEGYSFVTVGELISS